MGVCLCGNTFDDHVGKGQLKLHCSDRCRKKANRDKQKQEMMSRLEGLLNWGFSPPEATPFLRQWEGVFPRSFSNSLNNLV